MWAIHTGPCRGRGRPSSPAHGSSCRRLSLPQDTDGRAWIGTRAVTFLAPTVTPLRDPKVPCRTISVKPLLKHKYHWEVILRPWPLGGLAPHVRGPRAARAPQGRRQLPSHFVAGGDTGETLTVTSPTCYRGRQTPGPAPHQRGQTSTDSDRSSLLLPGTLPSN